MSDALVDNVGHPTEGYESSPDYGGNHGGSIPFHRLGTKAHYNDPAYERMEKSGVEDFEDEIDG